MLEADRAGLGQVLRDADLDSSCCQQVEVQRVAKEWDSYKDSGCQVTATRDDRYAAEGNFCHGCIRMETQPIEMILMKILVAGVQSWGQVAETFWLINWLQCCHKSDDCCVQGKKILEIYILKQLDHSERQTWLKDKER